MWGLKHIICICLIGMTSFMAFTSGASLNTQPGMTNVSGAMDVQNNQYVNDIVIAPNKSNPNTTGEVYVASKVYLEHLDELDYNNEEDNIETGDLAYHAYNPKLNDIELQEDDHLAPTRPYDVVNESEEMKAIFNGDYIAVPLIDTMDAADEYKENLIENDDEVFNSNITSSKDEEDMNTVADDGNENYKRDEELSKQHENQMKAKNNKDEITHDEDQSVDKQPLEEQSKDALSVAENNYASLNPWNIINNLYDSVSIQLHNLKDAISDKFFTFEPKCKKVIVTKDLIGETWKESDMLDRHLLKGTYALTKLLNNRLPENEDTLEKLGDLMNDIILHKYNTIFKLSRMITVDEGHREIIEHKYSFDKEEEFVLYSIYNQINEMEASGLNSIFNDSIESVITSLEIANDEIIKNGRGCEIYYGDNTNEKSDGDDQLNKNKKNEETLVEEKSFEETSVEEKLIDKTLVEEKLIEDKLIKDESIEDKTIEETYDENKDIEEKLIEENQNEDNTMDIESKQIPKNDDLAEESLLENNSDIEKTAEVEQPKQIVNDEEIIDEKINDERLNDELALEEDLFEQMPVEQESKANKNKKEL